MGAALTHGGDIHGFKLEHGRLPLDFSANYNPLGMPRSAEAAIANGAKAAGSYPDPLCRELCAAIARHEGVPAGSVFCSNGAADIIYRMAAALRPKTALLPSPCFAEYGAALSAAGCRVRRLPLDASRDFDLDQGILPLLERDVELLLLCNPNNPTGRLIAPGLLEEIARRCKQNGIFLVMDECFLGFCGGYERRSLRSAAAQGGGIMVINAFTKLYSMAGVRLGWCVCSGEGVIPALRAAGQPWAVSSIAQEAGAAALGEAGYLERTERLLQAERPRLAGELRRLGLRVIEGAANFLLFHSADKALAEKLRRKDILIRDCSNFEGLEGGWFRTAVKLPGQNDLLISAIAAALEEEQ